MPNDGIGPVLAISCKGMTGAFRNLTHRLEETIGECTNIHIGYPMLVFGYLFIARANRADQPTERTDLAHPSSNRAPVALFGRQIRRLFRRCRQHPILVTRSVQTPNNASTQSGAGRTYPQGQRQRSRRA